MQFTADSNVNDRKEQQFLILADEKTVATTPYADNSWYVKWTQKGQDGATRTFGLKLVRNATGYTATLNYMPKLESGRNPTVSSPYRYGEDAIEDVMSTYVEDENEDLRLNTKALFQSEQDERDAAELDRYYGDVKINLDGYSAVVKYDPDADCWIHDWTMKVPDQYDPYDDPAKRKLGTRKFTLTIIANRQRGSYSHQSWVATLRYAPQVGYNDSGGWGEEATAFSPQEAADSVLKSYTRSMNNWKQSPKSKLNWFLEK